MLLWKLGWVDWALLPSPFGEWAALLLVVVEGDTSGSDGLAVEDWPMKRPRIDEVGATVTGEALSVDLEVEVKHNGV